VKTKIRKHPTATITTAATETATATESPIPTVRAGSSVKRGRTTALRGRTTENQTTMATAMAEAAKGVATNAKMLPPSTIPCVLP